MRILVCLLALLTLVPAQTQSPLANSSSAYLRAAASQPVHWLPLTPETLKVAQKQNLPILLDVGATWCPWCALLDRDSYSDPRTADFINQHFIAIKLDYDADPQFTARLQRAAAVQNLPSGVPLILFLTPRGKLYFGGTYFPAKATADKKSFREALQIAATDYVTKGQAGTVLDLNSFRGKP